MLKNVHTHLQHLSVEELQAISKKDCLPFGVCILNLLGDLNTGIIMRTAATLGAERVIVFGKRKYDRRSAVGSQHYIEVVQEDGWDEEREYLEVDKFTAVMDRYNYIPFMLETEGIPITYWKTMDFTRMYNKPCLIFGNEGLGIPENIYNARNAQYYKIPQTGVIRSLNVSSAASIAIWEMSRSMSDVRL